MKLKKYQIQAMLMLLALSAKSPLQARSIHRSEHNTLPQLTVSLSDDPKRQISLRNSHLEQYPLFELFNKEYFDRHMLPTGPIAYRHDAQKVIMGDSIRAHLEILLKEIKAKKKSFSHFTLLTNKNFNRHKRVGMLILQHKHSPFIVKLSIETPDSFIDPFCKGMDNVWFFPMGGGINRHLAGFTRVKNQENVKKKLADSPYWSSMIDVPRKWYWLPEKSPWLTLKGENIGTHKEQSTQIPATYAIIADAIDAQRELELNNIQDTNLALDLCNYLEHAIDAHINNFVVEKKTGKIVIIDTEHFPSVIGIKEKVHVDSYLDWYTFMIKKCGNDWFFRTKKERLAAQERSKTLKLI